MADNRLHPIAWKNVIDYNWLRLQITITPCLVWIQQSQGWQVNNPRGRASHCHETHLHMKTNK
jgi:hypothetical protein